MTTCRCPDEVLLLLLLFELGCLIFEVIEFEWLIIVGFGYKKYENLNLLFHLIVLIIFIVLSLKTRTDFFLVGFLKILNKKRILKFFFLQLNINNLAKLFGEEENNAKLGKKRKIKFVVFQRK